MDSLEIGLGMLAVVFSGAMLGLLLGRRLPSHHMSSETKTAISVSTAVVGTMTALVIGLLISTAHSSFSARNGAVSQLAADITQLDELLRRYGAEAEPARQALQRYTAMKVNDLTPGRPEGMLSTDSTASLKALEQVQDLILGLKPMDNRRHWLIDQSMQLVGDMRGPRLLIEQDQSSVPLPFLFLIVLWCTILFTSFGLFAPRNIITIMALFLCAFAVSAAVKVLLDMDTPFGGRVRMSGFPLRISTDPIRHAIEVISH
jgi:hypothetical protein